MAPPSFLQWMIFGDCVRNLANICTVTTWAGFCLPLGLARALRLQGYPSCSSRGSGPMTGAARAAHSTVLQVGGICSCFMNEWAAGSVGCGVRHTPMDWEEETLSCLKLEQRLELSQDSVGMWPCWVLLASSGEQLCSSDQYNQVPARCWS